MSEMVWKLENDPYLCDMQRLQSNAHQHTPIATMMLGTYHHAQKKNTPDVLHPTQMLYRIVQEIRPCGHEQ